MAVERSLLQQVLAATAPGRRTGSRMSEAELSRYLPHCVLEQLEPGRRRASVERFDGAVLFTDLAGFSRITDQFSARGPEGVEQLSSMLDTYFGRMTEIALDHGGDVVDFVGDAIVVMWPGAGTLADSVAAAVACGLALQHALKDVVLATGLPLQQRVSIGAGELARFIVGGVDGKWRWLLAGTPMREAGASNHLAQPGQVLACESAWTLVSDRCRGLRLDAGNVLVEQLFQPLPLQRREAARRVEAGDSQIEEFVAQPLLERFRAGHWNWLGEFRNISAVFVGLPRLDVTTAQSLAQVQQATECMQHEFGRYGGSLESLAMDDKGISALAAFGLPAHEDDSIRAVRAAMALAAKLKALGIACSIGITHGRAFYGDSGGRSRRHVTLVGGVVNLAARLMQTAEEGILCDEPTRSGAARALRFSDGTALQLKGQLQPVPVYTPGAEDSSASFAPEPSIIGRAAERQRIERELERLRGGAGGQLLLCGEAGIGKSRLLREAAQLGRQRGMRILLGHGSSIETATPYFAWRRLLQQMLTGDAPFDGAAAREELWRRLRGEDLLGTWAPLLDDILPLQLPDNVITRQMESGARASSIRLLLIHLLRRLAMERPTLLLIDDLHWCDEASAGILAAVIEAVPQLLVLACTRPLQHSAAEATSRLLSAAEAEAHTLQLDQLPRAELDLLGCNKLGVRELPRELGDFVYARTGGHPFYSEELLLALRGAGLIVTQDGACRVGAEFLSAGLATMPTTLHGVIISRVDRLPPAEQLTLKLISVIGREFSLEMLRQLHPVADDAAGLEAIFAALQAADILRPAATGAPGEYYFKHAIMREVIYDLLPYAQRRQFHRDVALWIENRQAAHLEPYYAELALHWEKAGEVRQAIDYLEKAGALAFSRFANRPAIQHIRRAYSLAQRHGLQFDRERIANLEGILGDSHQELFEYDDAARHFKRCLEHLGLPVTESQTGLVLGLLKELLLQTRLRLFPRRGQPAQAADSGIRRAAHIYQRLAESSFFDNRMLDLLYQIMASINLAERSGATREIVDGFGAIAVVAVAARLRRASHYYNRRSMEITRGAGNPVDAAYGYLVDMVYWATLGVWDRQEQSLAPSEAIYRQLGGAVRWQQTQSITYTALIVQGRYDDAARVLQEARSQMNTDSPVQILSFWYCSMLGLALARAEPLEPLIAGLEEAQAPALHRADRMRSLGLIAKARWRLGQQQEALVAADAALAVVRQSMPTPWHIGDGIAAAAEVYMEAWDSGIDPKAQGKARQMCKALSGFAHRVPAAAALAELHWGNYLHRCGKLRAAEKRWRRAVAGAGELKALHEQGLALYQLGTALPAGTGDGIECLRQAQALFRRIGAHHDLERCAHIPA